MLTGTRRLRDTSVFPEKLVLHLLDQQDLGLVTASPRRLWEEEDPRVWPRPQGYILTGKVHSILKGTLMAALREK